MPVSDTHPPFPTTLTSTRTGRERAISNIDFLQFIRILHILIIDNERRHPVQIRLSVRTPSIKTSIGALCVLDAPYVFSWAPDDTTHPIRIPSSYPVDVPWRKRPPVQVLKRMQVYPQNRKFHAWLWPCFPDCCEFRCSPSCRGIGNYQGKPAFTSISGASLNLLLKFSYGIQGSAVALLTISTMSD